VATLVQRHSRFCMLVKVPGKDTATVVTALRTVGLAGSVFMIERLTPVGEDGQTLYDHMR
jgi:IS30 family transposase